MKNLFALLITFLIIMGANAQVAKKSQTNFKNSYGLAPKVSIEKANKEAMQTQHLTTPPPASYYNLKNTKGEIAIGEGELTNERYPIYAYYSYSYSQSIYLSEEIGIPGTITKIKYFFAGSSLSASDNWVIYMGHTNKSSISNENDWVSIAELTEVFNGVISWAANDWVEITLTTPFVYNGYDNLVIAINETKPNYNDDSDKFYNSYVSTNRSIIYFEDNNIISPNNPPMADHVQNIIPNVILSITPSSLEDHDLVLNYIANIPNFVAINSSISPKIKISNIGSSNEVDYSVNVTILNTANETVYNQTINNPGELTSISSLILNFPEWTAISPGTHTCTATIQVSGDTNNENNILTIFFDVMNPINAFAWDAYHVSAPNVTSEGPVNILVPIGSLSQIAVNPTYNFISAADYVLDEIYGIQSSDGSTPTPLVKIDPNTGELTIIGGNINELTGFAYDNTTNTSYVMDFNGVLYTIDLSTGITTQIGGNYEYCIALACSASGVLYAISLDNNLAIIDKTTGTATIIGSLGIDINYAQDLAYDRDNDILYGTLYTNEGGLYSINTSTGNATLINTFEDELTGFAIPYTFGGANITFNVVNNNTQPINDATIIINSNTITTDVFGVASIYLDSGVYSYIVSKSEHNSETGNITVVNEVDQTINVILSIITSINELKNNTIIYPNPTTDFVTLQLQGNYSLQLFDINGRVIQKQNAYNESKIDFSNLPKGVYTLQITFEKEQKTVKIVKE